MHRWVWRVEKGEALLGDDQSLGIVQPHPYDWESLACEPWVHDAAHVEGRADTIANLLFGRVEVQEDMNARRLGLTRCPKE